MEILIATAHIIGSIIALLVFGFLVLLIGKWEDGKIIKQFTEEASITLGIKIEDLENEENAHNIMKLSSERFSAELFKNRISDFCGLIRTVWSWLTSISQVIILIIVIWLTVTESSEYGIYAWLLVVLSILSWLVSVIFSLICKLFTGRYPGQAKLARKAIAELARTYNPTKTIKLPE